MEEEDTKEWVKIKRNLPDFDGTNPMGWLDQVEKFFDKHDVNSEQRVGMAFFHMKGPADYWFYCLQLQWPNVCWEKFRKELIKRFCVNRSSKVCEQMASNSWTFETTRRYSETEAGKEEIIEEFGEGCLSQFSALLLETAIGDLKEESGAGRVKGGYGSGGTIYPTDPRQAQFMTLVALDLKNGGLNSNQSSPAKSNTASPCRRIRQLSYAEFRKRKKLLEKEKEILDYSHVPGCTVFHRDWRRRSRNV